MSSQRFRAYFIFGLEAFAFVVLLQYGHAVGIGAHLYLQDGAMRCQWRLNKSVLKIGLGEAEDKVSMS